MGKVHGSLARAGKVKSQTPKSGLRSHTTITTTTTHAASCGGQKQSADRSRKQVEPQEKKKTPKGRAKKRIQYTRRFVNVTMTGGKRKMNPNPTT
ncbi:40S ribosomal protein S30 [Teratosphaeriaceae sp. CCFEE 6253]|nr:40S ribosomal protein S30 [Teratosphaeriaceae sp. CCFEE 6253]